MKKPRENDEKKKKKQPKKRRSARGNIFDTKCLTHNLLATKRLLYSIMCLLPAQPHHEANTQILTLILFHSSNTPSTTIVTLLPNSK